MLAFAHPYNLLCAHFFPGLVWCKGLLSSVDFLAVTRQGSFVRINGAGISPLFLPPSLLFLWLFLLALWRGCHLLWCGISMRTISSSKFGCSKRTEMLGKKLHWLGEFCHPPLPQMIFRLLGVSVTWDPVSGNLDWGKEGFAHHSRGDSSWGKQNPNNTLFIRCSRDSVFWDEGSRGWEYWRSDVEEEMKDKAVLAPTCHEFSSLAIDPSSSKNTVSFCLQLLPPISQSSAKAVAWRGSLG